MARRASGTRAAGRTHVRPFDARARIRSPAGQALSAQVTDKPYEPPCNAKNLCNRPRQCYVCTDAEYEVAANGYGQGGTRMPAREAPRPVPAPRRGSHNSPLAGVQAGTQPLRSAAQWWKIACTAGSR